MNRIKLLMLFGLFILPVAASYLAYYVWQPEGRKNYGELVRQVEVRARGDDLAGREWDVVSLKGKWIMIYTGSGQCAAECERLLYFMRQVRKSQGKEMSRVERLWIITDDALPAPVLQQAHEGLGYIKTRDPAVISQFAEGASGQHIYLVDPLGHLMMQWPKNPDPARMIKDLKHLLKASQIG